MTDLTIAEQIRERHAEILRIAARHGATRVRLIGSVARGEARPDSDIDLLVTWAEGRVSSTTPLSSWNWRAYWAGRSISQAMVG